MSCRRFLVLVFVWSIQSPAVAPASLHTCTSKHDTMICFRVICRQFRFASVRCLALRKRSRSRLICKAVSFRCSISARGSMPGGTSTGGWDGRPPPNAAGVANAGEWGAGGTVVSARAARAMEWHALSHMRPCDLPHCSNTESLSTHRRGKQLLNPNNLEPK